MMVACAVLLYSVPKYKVHRPISVAKTLLLHIPEILVFIPLWQVFGLQVFEVTAITEPRSAVCSSPLVRFGTALTHPPWPVWEQSEAKPHSIFFFFPSCRVSKLVQASSAVFKGAELHSLSTSAGKN